MALLDRTGLSAAPRFSAPRSRGHARSGRSTGRPREARKPGAWATPGPSVRPAAKPRIREDSTPWSWASPASDGIKLTSPAAPESW